MRLTDQQKRILYAAQLRADSPAVQIARELGLQEHSVRRLIQNLQSKKVIRRIPLINIQTLGYTDYCLFFSVETKSKASRLKLLTFLTNSPETAWVGELGGDYQFTVSLFARSIGTVDQFLRQLASYSDGNIIEKSVAVRVSWSNFSYKYLNPTATRVTSLTRSSEVSMISIDQEDRRILRALALYSERSHVELARALKIPVSTFSYRVQQLMKRKVITGYFYLLDPHALGFYPFRLLIYENHSTATFTRELYKFAEAHPAITEFVHCLGNWDYELNLRLLSASEVPEVVQELYSVFGSSIRSIKVLSELRVHKVCMFPFRE